MKNCFLCLFLLLFTGTTLFAQWGDVPSPDVPLVIGTDSDVWYSESILLHNNNVTLRLIQGTKVFGDIAAMRDEINGVFNHTATVRYDNNRYIIRTSSLNPVNGKLPEDWVSVSDTQRKWVISYYLDVLRSQNRDTFLNHERAWIDWLIEELEYSISLGEVQPDTRWYNGAPINFESLVFFDAVIIMGGFALCEFFITEIVPFNTGYKITMTGDRWFAAGRNFSIPAIRLSFPLPSERQSFDMIFIPDGDYMDVYLDTMDNHFASFAKVDAIVLEELEKLVRTNTVDLSNIVWPRRADGSMDFSPEVTNVIQTQQTVESSAVTVSENQVNEITNNIETQENAIVKQEAETSSIPLWVLIAIVGGAALVVIVMLVVVKRKR